MKDAMVTLCITAGLGFALFIVGITVGLLGMTKAGVSMCIVSCGCLVIAEISWREVCK